LYGDAFQAGLSLAAKAANPPDAGAEEWPKCGAGNLMPQSGFLIPLDLPAGAEELKRAKGEGFLPGTPEPSKADVIDEPKSGVPNTGGELWARKVDPDADAVQRKSWGSLEVDALS
jgi:hypothetical protein